MTAPLVHRATVVPPWPRGKIRVRLDDSDELIVEPGNIGAVRLGDRVVVVGNRVVSVTASGQWSGTPRLQRARR